MKSELSMTSQAINKASIWRHQLSLLCHTQPARHQIPLKQLHHLFQPAGVKMNGWQEDIKYCFRLLLRRLCGNRLHPSPEHTLVRMRSVCYSFLWSCGYSKGSIFVPTTCVCLKGDTKTAGFVLHWDPCLSPRFLHFSIQTARSPSPNYFPLLLSFFFLFRTMLIWSSLDFAR